jgi:aspartyl-tRNA(Asn)/glutamyl-tRNA(Gln) amidotransferase subunit A
MTDINLLTAVSTRTAIEQRQVTASSIADAFYKKIESNDKDIHAYLTLSKERAQQKAAEIDALADKGEALPPLAGVPIGIKDVLVTKGVRSTAGSKILENYIPPYTCTAVRRLEDAGAVILGKMNCDEFAMGSSNENSAYGPVKNPRDHSRVPGGSSGGSAAAVAAGTAVATLGTDTGGSIRQPAALCGVVGLMPTYGRVSRYGLIAFASSLDKIGPLTKTVADAALILRHMAGRDPLDSTSAEIAVPDYVAELETPIHGLRLGVPKEYFAEGLHAEVRSHVEATIQRLAKAGCEVVPISLPTTRYAIPTYYVIATAEASSNLARFDGVRYGHRTSEASTLSAMYRRSRDEGFGPEVKRRIMLGTYALSAGYYDAYYLKAQRVRALLAKEFAEAFTKVDAIVSPSTPTPAFKIGEKADDPVAMYLSDLYTVGPSLVGIPGISVPCGRSTSAAYHNLPIGFQILGRHFEESTILRLARAVESLTASA